MNDSILKAAIRTETDGTAVPQFDLAALRIRVASEKHSPRNRKHRWALAGLLFVLPAIAIAAVLIKPVYLRELPNGTILITSDTWKGYFRPTQQDLSNLVANARYRLILPAGLPRDARLKFIATVGTEAIFIHYSLEGRHQVAAFMITPLNAQISGNRLWLAMFFLPFARHPSWQHTWTVGSERVVLSTHSLSAAQISRIRHEMIMKGEQAPKQ
jgi:hypothetical protein